MTSFGTEFCDSMATMRFTDGAWRPFEITPLNELKLHPASQVLHYGSSCFEGFKAYKLVTDESAIFRLEDHCVRFRNGAQIFHRYVAGAK